MFKNYYNEDIAEMQSQDPIIQEKRRQRLASLEQYQKEPGFKEWIGSLQTSDFTESIQEQFDKPVIEPAIAMAKESISRTQAFWEHSARYTLSDAGLDATEALTGKTEDLLTEDEWKKSEHYREGVKFKNYYTPELAKSVANDWDGHVENVKKIEEGGLLGGLLGMAMSLPSDMLRGIGFLPYAKMLNITKVLPKNIFGAVGHGVVDFGIATAIEEPIVEHARGFKFNKEQYIEQIYSSMVMGAGFGAGGYAIGKLIKLTKDKLLPNDKFLKELSDANKSFDNQVPHDKAVDILRMIDTQKAIENGETPQIDIKKRKTDEIILYDPFHQTEILKPLSRTRNVYGMDGLKRINVSHHVVEMSEIQPSHLWVENMNLAVNKNYPPEMQPRERTNENDVMNIINIAKDIRYEEYIGDKNVTSGTPIVDKNGNVISGNGRTQALDYAYNMNDNGMKELLYNIGFNEEHPSGQNAKNMRKPILIAVLQDDLSNEQIKDLSFISNKGNIKVMTPAELAPREAAQLSNEDYLKIQHNDLINEANKLFQKQFMATKTSSEKGELLFNNKLSRNGENRIEQTVMYKAFEDVDFIKTLFEDVKGDDDFRSVKNMARDLSPTVARMRAKVELGKLQPSANIADNILQFVKSMQKREEMLKYLNTGKLFEKIPALTEMMMRSVYAEERDLGGRFVGAGKINQMYSKLLNYIETEFATDGMFVEKRNIKDILKEFDNIRAEIKGKENILPHESVISFGGEQYQEFLQKEQLEKATLKANVIENNVNKQISLMESIDKRKEEHLKNNPQTAKKELQNNSQQELENSNKNNIIESETTQEKEIYNNYKDKKENITKLNKAIDDFTTCVYG